MKKKVDMQAAQLSSIGVLGAGILSSYYYLSKQPEVKHFWGGLDKTPRLLKYWTASALLTAASFLYLMYYLVISNQQQVSYGLDYNISLLLLLLVFLISALCWVPLCLQAVKGNSIASQSVTWSLGLTAMSALGFLVLTVGVPDTSVEHSVASIAASIVAFHHIIWDWQVWRETWEY